MFVRGDRAVPLAALNADLDLGRSLIGEINERGGHAVSIGTGADADYRLERARSTPAGSTVTIRAPGDRVQLETRLPGPHNALNVTAAYALCDALGIDRGQIEDAILSTAGVPGRFELIDGPQPFAVVVDFAHNEGGLRSVVRTARELLAERPGGRLLAVVSAAVFFDSSQHAAIGRAARESTDRLILTSDPWPGDPPGISEALVRAARQASGAELHEVEDRREAIEAALGSARPGDVVLILGRGPCDVPMPDRSGRELPFDDRDVAKELLRGAARAAA
jgi:UDP-N-acetylmuramoyl-L-alanyl-D-glutamate--2,6-diaminopimelate ligase